MTADLNESIDRRALLTGAWKTRAAPAPIRPPGAIAEAAFMSRCDGCGDCAAACPADAIVLKPGNSGDGPARPEIDAGHAPCVMCDGLLCAPSCPTGALVPVAAEEMRIALLEFRADACWAARGIDPGCNYCFDRCPLQGRAVTFAQGSGPAFDQASCSGCGVCVHYCPSPGRPIRLTAIARA